MKNLPFNPLIVLFIYGPIMLGISLLDQSHQDAIGGIFFILLGFSFAKCFLWEKQS